jgi:hypothetical protein
MNKRDLWLKLKNYHFDHVVPVDLWDHITSVFGGTDASTKAFANKIARKHDWTDGFALRAIREYKKFVYLGVVSDFNVTPSKIIDLVWHEHLLFSKAYRDFCTDVIDYTFDHHPELVPMQDQTGRFNAQYMDTLALYKTEFGIAPPEDIWSTPKFDKEQISTEDFYKSKRKKESYSSNGYSSDTALYTYFDGSQPGYQAESFPEFSGYDSGDFGGAGAGGDFGNSDSSSDGGDSGDGGGGCSGGGCSGGCGGGD